jgi:hypothetical protein
MAALGGFAVLSGFLMLVYLFVNADPARLARGLKVTGIVIAVLAVATLAICGRLAALLMPLAMLTPALIRVRGLPDEGSVRLDRDMPFAALRREPTTVPGGVSELAERSAARGSRDLPATAMLSRFSEADRKRRRPQPRPRSGGATARRTA